jgi:TnpA family transposase
MRSPGGRRVQVTSRHAQHARALPRYFGMGRGVTFYTWTSDQHSHYASRVVKTSLRDATYVLDGILDNQTVLPIDEHTTDTHGYTEMIFGAYDFLGLRFAPRIRDLDRQRLYRHGPAVAADASELTTTTRAPHSVSCS